MSKRRKAPKNCYWRDDTLYAQIMVKGHRHRVSLRTDDAKVAQERIKAERERLVAALHYGDARQTWEDAVIAWADTYLPDRGVGEETIKRYAVSLKQLEPFLIGHYVDEIDRDVVGAIVDARRASGVTTATIRRDLTALAGVLSCAEDSGAREGNPALDRLRKLKERRLPIVLPDPIHVRRVIDRAPGLFAAMILAAWRTGCRQEELDEAPARGAIDHQRQELTVIGKGSKLRVIDLAPFDGYAVFRDLPTHLKAKTLFWHHDGKPYRNVSSRFAAIVRAELEASQKAAREAGHQEPDFRKFRFHDLRHLHAVEWLRSGRSIYDLQIRLGHESITTTEMYLKYLTPEQARQARLALPQKLPQLPRAAG